MDLPYSVIRGEIVGIQIVVFNYMNKDLTAEVLLNNEGQQFDFAEVSNEVHDVPSECTEDNNITVYMSQFYS